MTEGIESGLAARPRRAVRTDGAASWSGRDLYQQYLAELDAYPLLDAEAELALARTIEARELDLWVALLAEPARLDAVAAICAAHDARPEGWDAFRARADEGAPAHDALLQMAQAMRDADQGRAVRQALEQEVLGRGSEGAPRDAYVAGVARARRRHRAAIAHMVTANLRLVVALARRYGAPRLLSSGDFVQEGNLGLLRAVETFDHRRGVRFGTYAGWWIRHAFNRALSDRGRLVRVPMNVLEEVHRVARAQRAWIARHGAAPTFEQLAMEARVPVERIEDLLAQSMTREPLSLHAEVAEGRPMIDRLAAETPDPTAHIDAASFAQTVLPLFTRLTELEATVLRLRFGLEGDEPLTLREVGEKYGLTRERIRQLQEKALAKLRSALGSAPNSQTAA